MKLIAVKPQDRELFWNINQKYLYEMTNYYNDELDANGILHYGYFDEYFTDPKRMAYFLYDEDTLIGFAMIHPYSQINDKPDFVLAEFTVFPMYRRRHLATESANEIFLKFRGKWEVKFNEKNTAAKAFWEKITEKYRPKKTFLNSTETVLSFSTEEI